MSSLPTQPRLSETDTELLLFIHPSQKERAKSIDGRRWDPQRRGWIYPKTRRAYDAIIAEFGDELSEYPPRPTGPTMQSPSANHLAEENRQLRVELEKITAAVEDLARRDSHAFDESFQSLQEGLAASRVEAERLRETLAQRDVELYRMREELASARTDAALLTSRVEELQAHAKKKPQAQSTADLVKQLAKATARQNTDFGKAVDGLRINGTLPIDLAKLIETKLRRALGHDEDAISLHDLLVEARDAEMLSEETLDFAHLVRKQRNVFAHAQVNPETEPARILLVLFAASILWSDLDTLVTGPAVRSSDSPRAEGTA